MLSHALITFGRSLSRHRLYTALNLFGLAAGIAVFLVLLLVVRYERSYDRWIPHASDIYRLDTTWTLPGEAPSEEADSTFAAFPFLLADFPQIASATRVFQPRTAVSAGQVMDNERVSYVDAGFFDVLALPLVAGQPRTALADASSVILSESTARKYFGTGPYIGRSLDILQHGARHAFRVSAILRDLPLDTTLHFSILMPLTSVAMQGEGAFTHWGTSSGETYVRFRSRSDADTVASGLGAFVSRRAADTAVSHQAGQSRQVFTMSLVAVPDMHFHDISVVGTQPGTDPRVVLSLGVVGVLALLIAVINYVNLSTARAGLRAREVALRKVMGATRRMLLVQFLGEAVLLALLAALAGLALAELAVPAVSALGGWSIGIDYATIVPFLVALGVLVGLGAGLYPALVLSAFRPAAILAASRMPAGGKLGGTVRTALVLVQFASAVAFAICTLVVDAQAAFIARADLGFERQGLIVVASTSAPELASRQEAIAARFRAIRGVVSVARSDRAPAAGNANSGTVERVDAPDIAPSLVAEHVGPDYFPTYGIEPVAGRLLDRFHRTDDAVFTNRLGTVINQRAVAVLGFRDPASALGHAFTIKNWFEDGMTLTIVGVVPDMRFDSPRDAVRPQFYVQTTGPIGNAAAIVRFRGVPRAEIMARLQTAWRRSVPEEPFRAALAQERLSIYYRPDQDRARLFSAGAAIALGIACIGLYGLTAFNTARRVREIGIRKVLGASTRDVLVLLIGQFLRPVLIANLIAWPLAWVIMRSWLSGFDQRVALSAGYFLLVTAGALGLSILTVLGQAFRVARAEPAKALRHE